MSFKDHFSGHAGIYREARPRYPSALFAWLAAQSPACALAWDAGCGSGQASVALAAHFARVYASDPSAAQIANAEAAPNIDYRIEAAETCSLADASADLVCVGQALHWFDLARFHAEARRVLKPDGVIAEFSYAHCHVGAAVDAITDHLYTELVCAYWPPERALVDNGYRTLAFPFTPVSTPQFTMQMHWNAQQFLGYLRSWSACQRHLAANGDDPVSLVEQPLLAAWGDAETLREVTWDFTLRVGRV